MNIFKTEKEKRAARMKKLLIEVAGLKAEQQKIDEIMANADSTSLYIIGEERTLASNIARREEELRIICP